MAEPALAAPASKSVAVAAAAPAVHVVNRGDTLLSIARHNHVPVAELARANGLAPTASLKLGMKLTVPGSKTAAVAPPTPALQPLAAAQPAAAAAVTATKMAAAGPAIAAKGPAGPVDDDARGAGRSVAGQGRRGDRRVADRSVGRCAAR